MRKTLSLLLIILLSFTLISCSYIDELIGEDAYTPEEGIEDVENIDEDGQFTDKENVALYIHTYDKLPDNFITKKEASKLGWESNKGNLWEVIDQKSIGGDRFGNREGNLPKKKDRQYYECDINYEGGYRGAKRIVYSNDGLVYYTEDHYDTFTLIYGDE